MGWKNSYKGRNRSYLTKYCIDKILSTGRYVGTRPVNRYRRMRTSLGNWESVDWIADLLSKGIIKEHNLSINWAYPDRPIQIVLEDGIHVTEDMMARAKNSGLSEIPEYAIARPVEPTAPEVETKKLDPESVRKLNNLIGKIMG